MDTIDPFAVENRVSSFMQIPEANNFRRELKSFLASMHLKLADVDQDDVHLPIMRQWQQQTMRAILARDVDVQAVAQNTYTFLHRLLQNPLLVAQVCDPYIPEQFPVSQEFAEIALRQKCNHFVCEMEELFQMMEGQEHDLVTAELKELHGRFLQMLTLYEGNSTAVLDIVIPIFQEILTDPFGIPLDAALLGSDGNTYGYMWLMLCCHKQPNFFPPTFFVEPHPIAQFVLDWLQTLEWRGGAAALVNEGIKDEFDALMHSFEGRPDAPMLPTKQDVEDRLWRQEMEALEQSQMETYASLDANYQAILHHPIQQAVADYRAAFDVMKNDDVAAVEGLKEQFKEELDGVYALQATLEQKAQGLHDRVGYLKANLDNLSQVANDAERSIAQLQVAIAELEAAIEDRKAAAMGNFVQSIVIIGACIFATWALSTMLQAAAGTAAGTAGAGAQRELRLRALLEQKVLRLDGLVRAVLAASVSMPRDQR